MKTCIGCSQEFEPTNSRQRYCSRKCSMATNQKKRYDAHRSRLNSIKVDKGCARCGYNSHPAALQWNHINRDDKSFEIGSMVLVSWSRIEAEMAKCEVLCSNCHAIHSHEHEHHRPATSL